VLVTDAATGERLAASAETDRPCAASGKGGCPDAGDLAYRIGGAPAGRDVVLTLLSGTQALDSRRVQLEQAGVVTQAPALVVPYGAGPRSLQGHVLPAGPFGIGGEPTHWAKPVKLTVRLLDQNETEVQRATVHATDRTELSDSFALGDLPACEGCTLELLDGGGIVQDRVPVTVRPDSPGVTVADLGYQQLPGGAYVQGKIVARRQTSPGKLRVQVLDAAGKVLADSDKVRTAGSGGGGGGGKSATRFDYRLGGIPRELGTVKVVVLGGKTKLASTNVTLAPGTADTNVPDLKVDVSGGGGKR
jgi:hypothetical protein